MLSLAAKRLIGVLVLVGGILIVIIGVSRPDPFADTETYYAEFDSVQGLGAVGRDIRMAGVNVGKIGVVEREGDNAVVELVVESDVVVKEDAWADMRPHTLFEGSSLVDLSPGSPSAAEMEPGGMIPNERTSNYITLDEALRILRPEIRESLRELAGTGSKTLRGGAIEGIQKTLRNGPELTRRLKGPARALQGSNRRELAGAVAGMARTVDAVASREDQLIPLARRLNRTTAALTVDGGGPLDATLAALPGALRELNDGAPTLTALIDRLDRFVVEVNPAIPDLTLALEDATPLLKRSIPVLEKTTPIVRDLRRISGRIAAATPTLTKLVRSIDPVAQIFGQRVLPVLLSPSRNGPATYEQLLATFTDANGVFRQYQRPSQNPLGAGHLWNIGTYIDFTSPASGFPRSPASSGAGTPGDPLCETVAKVSEPAAEYMRAKGTCS